MNAIAHIVKLVSFSSVLVLHIFGLRRYLTVSVALCIFIRHFWMARCCGAFQSYAIWLLALIVFLDGSRNYGVHRCRLLAVAALPITLRFVECFPL